MREWYHYRYLFKVGVESGSQSLHHGEWGATFLSWGGGEAVDPRGQARLSIPSLFTTVLYSFSPACTQQTQQHCQQIRLWRKFKNFYFVPVQLQLQPRPGAEFVSRISLVQSRIHLCYFKSPLTNSSLVFLKVRCQTRLRYSKLTVPNLSLVFFKSVAEFVSRILKVQCRTHLWCFKS